MLNKTYFPLYETNSEKRYKDMEKKIEQLRKAYVKIVGFYGILYISKVYTRTMHSNLTVGVH